MSPFAPVESGSFLVGRIDHFPIILHVHDGPTFGFGFIESFVDPDGSGRVITDPDHLSFSGAGESKVPSPECPT
jgi:hypothetical protein